MPGARLRSPDGASSPVFEPLFAEELARRAVIVEHREANSWLRGERDNCKTVAIPTLAEEDAKRPNREREGLVGKAGRRVTLLSCKESTVRAKT